MEKIGIPETFTHLVWMLLQDASASVTINGHMSKPFPIQRGVQQGCPLALYLFLLVAEALNMATKDKQRLGRILEIQLPDSEDRQLISQYADDTDMSIIAQEFILQNIVSLIDRFGTATALLVNP